MGLCWFTVRGMTKSEHSRRSVPTHRRQRAFAWGLKGRVFKGPTPGWRTRGSNRRSFPGVRMAAGEFFPPQAVLTIESPQRRVFRRRPRHRGGSGMDAWGPQSPPLAGRQPHPWPALAQLPPSPHPPRAFGWRGAFPLRAVVIGTPTLTCRHRPPRGAAASPVGDMPPHRPGRYPGRGLSDGIAAQFGTERFGELTTCS
jgi:hypothetical protein